MAYALLAGVPPIYGLYASLIPLIIYALFASSNRLSVGPVAVSALLILAGISQIAEPGSAQYISYVITCGLFIGLAQISLGLLRLGFLVNFLSHPVIAGFTSAAAIIISISQIKDAMGIPIESRQCLSILGESIRNIGQVHLPTFIISLISISTILIIKKVSPKIPGALLVVLLAIGSSYFFNLESHGVKLIGAIPAGLPEFTMPTISVAYLEILWPTIMTVTLIGIVESIGIAKALETKHKDHIVNANQEMIALGLAKVGGSFFQSIPTSGSFSRSAINSNSGGKTTVSSLITAVLIVMALLFLTSFFYYLPKAVLASIILLAVISLFDLKEAKYLWKTNRKDLAMMGVTFFATLAMGIEAGVLCGVLLSILLVLYKTSRPHIAELGHIQGTEHYKSLSRFEEAERFSDTLIIRFDNQLYYGNASFFKDRIYEMITSRKEIIKYIILDGSHINDIDSTGMHVLKDLDLDFKSINVELHLCGAIGPVRDSLYLSGLLKEIDRHHHNVHDAVTYIHGEDSKSRIPNLQTNLE